MGQALTLLVATLLAAQPAAPREVVRAGRSRPAAAERKAPVRAAPQARQARRAVVHRSAPTLAEARERLKALMRDGQKRRFRHHWEKAIRDLQAAAVGKDAAEATLQAARARYALYRWSANEPDRDEALRLARKATALGSKGAAGFAAAVRREAGDGEEERPVRAKATAGKAPRAPRPAQERPEALADAPPDPELEAAVADLGAQATPIPLGQSGGEGTATVAGVKAWANDDYTRVAIYLDHWVGWQKLELPAGAGSPRRLALDFKPARLDGEAMARAVGGDQVDRVRTAQYASDTVRVVLDLPGGDAVRFYSLDDPPRLIVDVGTRQAAREVRQAAAAREASPAREAASREAAPEARGAREADEEGEGRPIRRVVVDAGHGGHDPGAIGPTRVREKDATLAIARRLAAKLKKAGFEVVMTRSDDRFVALEERTAIANTRKGDLFVSIHANAHPRRALAGVETWVLNVADDRYAVRLAARENGADLDEAGEGSQAQRILTDLDAKAATGASRRLAHLVQREITGAVRTRFGEVQDLGVKSALFYVLLGARMPAVLVETAFISNRREEQRLASPAYQDEVASAVSRAVEQFARSGARVARAGPEPE